MKNSRRSQILQHIAEITSFAIADQEFQGINTDAFTISLDLDLDRANVSRMLNDLWRENELIKIQGRPTFYLHRKTLIKNYPNTYIPALIPKNENLLNYLEQNTLSPQQTADEAFTSYIGHSPNESMSSCIEDIKVFFSYPQSMHSLLLYGPPKSGKHFLLTCILQYLQIESSDVIHIDCAFILLERITLQEVMTKIDTSLEKGKKSVILFENLHTIQQDFAIMSAMEAMFRLYQTLAEKNNLHLLFFALSYDIDMQELSKLNSLFQKVYILPELDERTLKEKYEFVLAFMQSEANTVGKTISLSSSILNCFATSYYPHNLQSLQIEIRHALSYAYAQSRQRQDTFITIDYDHLSDRLLSRIQNISDVMPIIESVNSTLQERNHFLIPETECLPLQKLMHSTITKDGVIQRITCRELNLHDYCKQELRMALNQEINQLYSHSLLKIKNLILPILKQYRFELNDKLCNKLCFRLHNLISLLQNHSYISNFLPEKLPQHPRIQEICSAIQQILEKEFHVELPEIEQQFLFCYLYHSQDSLKKGSIAVLVACQGEGIAEKYATHVNTMKYKIKCHYINQIDLNLNGNLNTFHKDLVDKILEIDEGSGVVIITDLNPLFDFDGAVRSRTEIATVSLCPTSLPLLIQVMNLVNDPATTLEDIRNFDYGNTLQFPSSDPTAYGIEIQKNLDDVANKILSDSLVFLNPQKVTMALFRVLMQIYEDLELHYTNEISIRFIFHSAFMIERVIRKEPLIYKNTAGIIASNQEIYTALDRNLQLINDLFGITIPSSEIARLSEIFVDLLQEIEEDQLSNHQI